MEAKVHVPNAEHTNSKNLSSFPPRTIPPKITPEAAHSGLEPVDDQNPHDMPVSLIHPTDKDGNNTDTVFADGPPTRKATVTHALCSARFTI